MRKVCLCNLKTWPAAAVLVLALPQLCIAQSNVAPQRASVRYVAQPVKDRPAFKQCMDGAGGVTANMLNCIGAEETFQDKRLNSVYKSVLATQTAAQQQATREAERQWIQDRDQTCKTQSAKDGGGTLSGVEYASCFLSQTIRQADHLQERLDASRH